MNMDLQALAQKFNCNVCGTAPLRTVFTAQSKAYFYCKEAVCEFVFGKGMLPLNPFMAFGYFLHDRVERDLIRRANNHLLSLCDELWVFGDIANGVLFEILLAKSLRKPIRYFTIAARSAEIAEAALSDLAFESEMALTQEQIDAFILLATA